MAVNKRRSSSSHGFAFCRQLFPHLVAALRDVAAFVGCHPADLAFMPNATTALNTVIANVPLQRGDEVLMLDIGYGSVKKMAQAACDASGATLVQAEVPLPIGYALKL